MSKSLGKEFFDQYGDKWKAAASKKGIPNEVLTKTWDDLCAYGSWAFNRSHSVAYGIVSYWCCWLKAHYSLEFAAATLDAETDPLRQIQILRELATEGITYVPFDAELSVDRWMPGEKDGKRFLVGPLTSVQGIGPAAVNEILVARKRNEPLRPALAKRLKSAATTIDSLFPIGDQIKRLHPDLAAMNIVSAPTPTEKIQVGIDGAIMAIGVVTKIMPRDMNDQ
jgi:DNA polymerase III alpha subunit